MMSDPVHIILPAGTGRIAASVILSLMVAFLTWAMSTAIMSRNKPDWTERDMWLAAIPAVLCSVLTFAFASGAVTITEASE